MPNNLNHLEVRQTTDEIMRIFSEAVREAQEENRRLGVPSVYVINGQRWFELPNGELTQSDPYADEINGAE